PYQSDKVHVHLDDGRNFLRSAKRQYDLIIYALVDSLVLQSSYSNIRLESYLFTEQAYADVRRHLKPNGIFAMYNFYRQGWLVSRLHQGVTSVFETSPLVIPLPYHDTIRPEDQLSGEFTVLMAGDKGRMQHLFRPRGH